MTAKIIAALTATLAMGAAIIGFFTFAVVSANAEWCPLPCLGGSMTCTVAVDGDDVCTELLRVQNKWDTLFPLKPSKGPLTGVTIRLHKAPGDKLYFVDDFGRRVSGTSVGRAMDLAYQEGREACRMALGHEAAHILVTAHFDPEGDPNHERADIWSWVDSEACGVDPSAAPAVPAHP